MAKVYEVEGFRCPHCDEIHTGNVDEVEAWQISDETIEEDGKTYVLEEPEPVTLLQYYCETDGEYHYAEDSVEEGTYYMCSECKSVYEEYEDARTCCA